VLSLLSPTAEKWVAVSIFIATFAAVLWRRVPIHYLSLGAAALLVLLGIVPADVALFQDVNWDVLAIYFGYGVLAAALTESGVPALLAYRILLKTKKEKYALLLLSGVAAALSAFMPNPVVVLALAPLAIEMADRMESPLFLYLICPALASNAVTTVSMVADPPALILAASTGMRFLDFYWFKGRPGLGTLSVIAVAVALLTLLVQLRRMNKKVALPAEKIEVSYGASLLFVLSVLALALIPTRHPGIIGLILGVASILLVRHRWRAVLREFDIRSMLFLAGIFVVVGSLDKVGAIMDFSTWIKTIGASSSLATFVLLVWISVGFSSFVDNVPYTVLMIPTCKYLAQMLGMSPYPFYYGMLVGTGIGGNITPVGATANVLACGILEKRGQKVELAKYLKISIPFTFAAVLAGQLLLQLFWL